MPEEIEITIDREGNVTLHVKGVKGPRCEELTRSLEEAIGELEERTRTAEFYEDGEQDLKHKDRLGGG